MKYRSLNNTKIRSFSAATLLLIDDNSTLTDRVNELLKKENPFNTPISASKTPAKFMHKRIELDMKLEGEKKTMDEYLVSNSKDLNLDSDSTDKWSNLNQYHYRLMNKLAERMATLKQEDPSFMFEMFKLNRVQINTENRLKDNLEILIYESKLKEFEEKKTDSLIKSAYEYVRSQRLAERKKVLDEDKEFALKEKQYLENLKPSSLIDDFADVSLEQPSYMDPDD